MSRWILILSTAALGALAAACSGAPAGGPCTGAQAPEACKQSCTGDGECPSGFHCGTSGTCFAECTVGGSECGSNELCDPRGHCAASDIDAGDSGPGGGGPPRPDANCPDLQVNVETVPPSVQILLDQSGSMAFEFGNNCDTPPEGDDDDEDTCPSRNNAMESALTGTNGVITTLQDRVNFGLSTYTANTTCLDYDASDRGLNNFDDIKKVLDRHGPAGFTPTGPAITAVIADFALRPPPPGSPKVIVLATDGEPNQCNNSTADGRPDAINAAKLAFAAGIKVYILSVGSDIAESHLQEMANVGAGKDQKTGTEKFYKVTNPEQLAAALSEILGSIRTCKFGLDATLSPRQAENGEITIGGKPLTLNTDWKLIDNKTIELVGNACQSYLADGGDVKGTFPCGVVID